MKIYLVTKGSYSDKMNCAVFSTKELAQEYIDKKKDFEEYEDYNDIEEYEVDDPLAIDLVIKDFWTVTIFIKDGLILEGCGQRNMKRWRLTEKYPVNRNITANIDTYGNWGNDPFITITSYISLEHAKKLAVEKRQEYLRKNVQSIFHIFKDDNIVEERQ